MRPFRVLFVCTGNICRSPLAEALFAHYVRQQGLEGRFEADSSGLGAWHVGEAADPRARRAGERHGVPVPSIARQIAPEDFERFDLIVAMDRGHLSQLQARARGPHRDKVRLMRDYDEPGRRGGDVPDPYYGGAADFEEVFRMLEVCCRNLLQALEEPTAGARRPGP